MITITLEHRIFLGVQPVDFRRGIDGLAALCYQRYLLNPKSGSLFVFRNQQATAIKLLWFDNHGFWLAHRRLSRGKLVDWPNTHHAVITLSLQQLHTLLYPIVALSRF